ncbi:MAG: glycoside hydrolase family 16 protein [Oscillospiraceae bacterium]|nr:glycoside hydrolase family 16 protein [Oscillospiraceae bacterium]
MVKYKKLLISFFIIFSVIFSVFASFPASASTDGNILLGPLDTIYATDSKSTDSSDVAGSSEWYGDDTWTNYIVEADISNLQNTGAYEWWNFQFRLRYAGQYYYYTYINGAEVDLKDSITWSPTLASGTADISPDTDTVHYKFVVDGDVITCYAGEPGGDLKELFSYTDDYSAFSNPDWDPTPIPRDVLATGKAGWATEGVTCTISNFTVTAIGNPADNAKTPIVSASISPIKAPAAGIYPQGMFKSDKGLYKETLEWNPNISDVFKTDTVYTAKITLESNSLSRTFNGIQVSDIGGLPTENVTSVNGALDGDKYVITVVFDKTGSSITPFSQDSDLLFSDDFNENSLDTDKWDTPNEFRQDRSAWDSSMVSVKDGNLVLGLESDPNKAKNVYSLTDPNIINNFIVSGAVQTSGKFENTYGYYEASIKFPSVRGTWGAFWLYNSCVGGTDYEGVDGTEIDVIESIFNEQNKSDTALHWNGYGDAHRSIGATYAMQDYSSPTGIYDGEFHTYAMDWSPDSYIFYIDGKEVWRTTGDDIDDRGSKPGICQNPLALILSVEGADWAGNLPSGFTYDEMLVDYVRVYDRPKADIEAAEQMSDVSAFTEEQTTDAITDTTQLPTTTQSMQRGIPSTIITIVITFLLIIASIIIFFVRSQRKGRAGDGK